MNYSVVGSPDRAAVRWFLSNSHGSSSTTAEDKAGKPISDIDAEAVVLPDSPAGVTLHADVAAGNWTTIFTASGTGSSSQAGQDGSFLISNTFIVNRRTHVVFAYAGHTATSRDLRLVAIDHTGKLVPATGSGCASTDSTYVGEYSVALPQNSIRQWQLQTRPFNQWIEIRGISLHPGQKTTVTTATSDDQPNP
jgi:hypothetical protein